MKKIILNFENIQTKHDIHNYLLRKIELPDYYGNNLDSLFSCLTDISEPTAFKLENIHNEYLEMLQQVFIDAETENNNIAVFYE